MKEKMLSLVRNRKFVKGLIIVLVAVYAVFMITDFFGIGITGKETTVEIPNSASTSSISCRRRTTRCRCAGRARAGGS